MCVCYTDRICVRKRLSFGADFVASEFPAPAWRNWQTRWTQNPVIARSCGFEPLRRQDLADFASKKALRTPLNTNILRLCSTERSLSAFFSQEDWFSPRTQHLLPFKVMF